MSTIKLEVSPAEFEQITVDVEAAIQELDILSEEIDWFVTDLPDRLRTALEIINREQE